MYRKLADTIILDFTVHTPTTGAVADADSLPTVEVFEDDTDSTLSGASVTKRTGKTGNYRVTIPATGANGFEVGKSYNVVVSAVAGGITVKAVIGSFSIDGKRLSDLNDITAPDLSNLDAAVSTRAPEALGNLAAVKAKTDNLPTTPASLDEILEGTTTVEQAIRLLLASLVGKSSGIGTTTVTVRDINDTKDRIIATVDATGNRIAVTRDGT
jgi:hypothetical protein